MTAKFNIKLVFQLGSGNCLVVGGDIVEGEVRQGMQIAIADRKIPIAGIEMIDRKEGAITGLLIGYKNGNEKNTLEKLFKNVHLVTITR